MVTYGGLFTSTYGTFTTPTYGGPAIVGSSGDITALLDTPFYTGADSTTEVPYPYPCALGGHGYFLDTQKYARETVDVLRQAFDQGGEAGEQTLSVEGYWRRTADDWSLGAGQLYWDGTGGQRSQFYTSKGVDCFTTISDLSLLNDTRQIVSSTNTNLQILRVGIYTYVVDGNTIKFTTDPSVPSPTFTTVTGTPAAQPLAVTTDGNQIWISYAASGLYSTTAGGASVTLLNAVTNPEVLEYANGYLVGAISGVAKTISAAGTATTITNGTPFNPNFRFAAITSTPTAIIFGGNADGYGQFFSTAFVATTGALNALVPSGRLPDGETVVSLSEYAGLILIGTSRGVRIAAVSDNGSVQPGPLIVTGGAVRAFEPQGDFVWFTWENYDGVSTGLGRMQLSDFTAISVPAYASDLMAAGQGTVKSIATFGNYRYFSVAGLGIYAEYDTKVASGTVDSGWISFSTPERKVVANLDLRHAALHGTINATILTEDGTITTVGSSGIAGSLSPVSAFGCSGVSGEYIRVELELVRSASDITQGPILRRWTLRAVAAPAQVEAFTLPILLFERVDSEVGDGGDYYFNPLFEWQYLKSLEASREPVLYQEGESSYLVTIRSVSLAAGDGRGWDSSRSFIQGTWTVRAITLAGGN